MPETAFQKLLPESDEMKAELKQDLREKYKQMDGAEFTDFASFELCFDVSCRDIPAMIEEITQVIDE